MALDCRHYVFTLCSMIALLQRQLVGEAAVDVAPDEVANDCWTYGVDYESCCSHGELGVGNRACWNDGFTYEICCTPPNQPRSFEAPITFARRPLRLGVEAPTRNLSTEPTHAESKWATGNSVSDYIEERWRLASDPALLAIFRSRNASAIAMGQACNSFRRVAGDLQDWELNAMLESLFLQPGGQHITSRLQGMVDIFDSFGSPEVEKMFVMQSGNHIKASGEFLSTLLWIIVMHRLIRHDGHVDGQLEDGQPGGLPLPEQLGQGRHELQWDIVEVGAGWGWIALLWQIAFRIRSYSIVDLPAAEAVQSFVTQPVRETTAFLSTKLLSDEVLPRYDLFISMFALTELDPNVREHYLEKLIVRSRRGFIIDNSHALRRRDSHEGLHRAVEWYSDTTGLDLVFQLRQVGFTVRITTLNEALNVYLPEPVGVALVITWVNTTEPYPLRNARYEVVHDWKAIERLADRLPV